MSIDAIMHAAPRSPTQSTRSSRDYDTGFPEPFCGSGNTTWRHPDANTSPDACITSDDIAVDKVYTRSRRSFLQNKNKRTTLSHGKLTGADLGTYTELSAIAEIPSRAGVLTSSSSTSSTSSSQHSRLFKDGDILLLKRPSSAAGDTVTLPRGDGVGGLGADSVSIRSSSRPATSHSGLGRHNSVFRKLRHHD